MSARKSWWRRWLIGVLIILLVLVMLPVGAWLWAGSDGSLSQALRLAQKFLPDGQSLEFRDAEGSITAGGSIGNLQWSMPGTALTIDGFKLDWTLSQLFHHNLEVRRLEAGTVHVRLGPQPEQPATEPFTMPADASLPITLTLPLAISSLQIETVAEDGTSSTLVINDLAARYRFDGTQHALTLQSVRYGQSSAEAQMQLDAHSLALEARLTASIRDLAPDAPFAMQLKLQADGNLGGDASLAVQFDGSEIMSADAEAGAEIHVQAAIHPWAGQPAQQVELQFSRLNARAFSNQAPVTDLHGQATLQPVADAAAAWDYMLDLTNDAPGAWDQQHLPLKTVAASGQLDLQQLRIDTARLDLFGSAAAGSVMLAGAIPLQQPAQSTLQLELQQLDLQPLLATLPRTAISGTANVDPQQIRADIRNTLPGPLDRERLPLEQLLADIRITPEAWRAESVELKLGAGGLQLQGQLSRQDQSLELSGQLQHLPVGMIHSRLAEGLTSELTGTAQVSGNLQQAVDFDLDITGNGPGLADEVTPQRGPWEIRAVQTSGQWSPTRLAVARIHLDAFQARVDGNDIEVALPNLEAVKASMTASAPGLELAADATMPVQSGEGRIALQLTSAEQVLGWLRGLPLIGEQLPIQRATGTASLQADWQGNWRDWVDGLSHPQAHPQLHLNANATAQGFQVELAQDTAPLQFEVPQLDMQVQGNLASASVLMHGDVLASDTHASLDLRAQMTQGADDAGNPLWNVALDEFAVATTLADQTQPWQLRFGEGLQITAQTVDGIALHTSAGSASLSAPPGVSGGAPLELNWQPLTWHQAANGATSLISSGSIRGIQPAWLDTLLAVHGIGPLAGAGMRSDLLASGDWDVQMTDQLNVRARLQRDSGDIWLLAPSGGDIAAGMAALDINVQSSGEDVSLALNWDTQRAGIINARVQTQLEQHEGSWALPDAAPLAGTVRAQLQDMGAWGFLTPPGWRVQGMLDANITLAGTVQEPHLQGSIAGTGLNIRSLLDGVDLHDGALRATLNGRRLDIDELTFQGGTGSRAYVSGQSGNRTQPPSARGQMSASGMIDWSGVASASDGDSGIAMDFKATLQQMQVLVRHDRQLTVSGDLSAGLQQGALRVRGDLKVDRAAIVLPEASAATLGDDVKVVRAGDDMEARAQLQTARPMDLQIKLNLGRDLALQGEGITTRLEGELTVRNTDKGNDPVSVVGEIRTDQGRYRAWGQALNVETGQLLFNGPYGNPSLNLLAIRPDIDVRAGVRVTGTLLAPQLQLFSEPEMPEAEKLSWVVLGRAPAASSAEGNSMQQAALGLLAGQVGSRVASGIGLDEVGLSEEGVSVGKRLGDELYVTYVAGLSGAASTLYLFYDITRRLTVRGQTGDSSAVDLIYTVTFD